MEAFIIISLILVFVALIVLIIIQNAKKTEQIRYQAAAGNILREDFLDYSLQNHMSDKNEVKEPRGKKTMIYIKTKGNKNARFVFDPEKTVNIGRNKNKSNIYINESTVSQNHCMIYSVDDQVYLKDCYSSNGTVVMRGWFRRYSITGGSKIRLITGDRISVGSCVFSVTLFFYDMSQM